MKIMPQIHSIEDCVSAFSFALRLTATLPLRVTKSNSGRTELIRPKHGLRNFSEMAVIYAVIIYGQKIRYGMIDPEDYLSYFGVVAMCTNAAAVALTTSLILYFKQDHYIKALNIMHHVDTEIRQIGVHVSYTFWFKITVLYSSMIIFVPVMLYASHRPWNQKIFDSFAYYYSLVIRCCALSYPISVMLVTHERFQQLNNILNILDDDEDECTFEEIELKKKLLKKLSPSLILDKVTTLHASLVEITKECNAAYSLIVLVNVVTNIVQSTFAIMFMYIGNHKEITIAELVIFFVIYNGQMLTLGLLSFFLEYEAKNTLATLGHLNICYFDQKLAFKKNTLLLQGLHNKVDFNVCGMFPLNANILLKQFNVCKNLVLLILQNYYEAREETR